MQGKHEKSAYNLEKVDFNKNFQPFNLDMNILEN